MESGHKSGVGSALPGGAGGEGVLCHACGYQYPNVHPSAKQRRAHRRHCGKPPSAAAAAEEEDGAGERDGKGLLQGEGGGGGVGGEGIGASAAECGAGLPGSAPEVGDAVEHGDNAGHSSGNGTGHQVIEDRSAEDCLISCNNIPSEITSEDSRNDNDGTMTTFATQDSEKGSHIEYGDPSDPAVSSEKLQDVPSSVLPPEPAGGARFSSEISEYEIQNSSVVSLASNATGGGMSEHTNNVVSELSGIAVTEEDGMINTTSKNKPSVDMSVKDDEFGLSCQGNLQTSIGDEHCSTIVEQDSSDKNLDAIHNEENSNDESESSQQSKLILTNPIEEFPNTKEPLESITEKSVGTDDDLLKSGTSGCHSETLDIVEPQQQPDSTSVTEDHLAIPRQAENVEGCHYPNTDEGIQGIPSAIGSVSAKVVSVDGAANITEIVCSYDVTVGVNMQKNVTTSTVVPTQVDLVEVSTSVTADEINMVGSTNDVDEKGQNEQINSDLTSHEVNEMHIVENIEEKQQNKEVITDPSSHETNVVFSTDNYGGNEQNEECIAETSSCKINAVQSTISIEEKELIEEKEPASEKTNETSSRDIVEEKKQNEFDVKINREIDVACNMETIGENNNATSCEISAGNTTDNVEDKMQNEESTAGLTYHGINMICSTNNEEKMHTEKMAEGLSSHETIVVHEADNVEEKTYEETKADPTSQKCSVVTSTDSVEERTDEETTADSTSHEINAMCTIDNVEEKKNEEPILNPASSRIGTVGSIGDVEGKKQNEETTADPTSGENNTLQETTPDPSSGENNTLQIADDPQNNQQHGDTRTDPASDKTEVAQNTNNVEEREKTEDTATREIDTIQSADDPKGADQNEEVADKEMVADSDRNHVSLKVLLADKNVEAKEKKASTKDRVLSFRRRGSKDEVSPVKPGSPKAGSGQQDWNSPARLPAEKKPKGRKQQWVPFICCSSIQ